MTVVFHRYRPGVAPYRGAIQSIVASRNHAGNGYLTLDRLPGRGLRCNSHHSLDWGVLRCRARNQRAVRHCGCFRFLRVRESRLKNAKCNHKGEEIETKVADEAVLGPPLREYVVKNSIAWQKVTRSVEFDRKAPQSAGNHTVLNAASICSNLRIPKKSSLDVAYQQRLLALDTSHSMPWSTRLSSPVGN